MAFSRLVASRGLFRGMSPVLAATLPATVLGCAANSAVDFDNINIENEDGTVDTQTMARITGFAAITLLGNEIVMTPMEVLNASVGEGVHIALLRRWSNSACNSATMPAPPTACVRYHKKSTAF